MHKYMREKQDSERATYMRAPKKSEMWWLKRQQRWDDWNIDSDTS